MIDIRYCRLNEYPKLQDFIGKEWKENHILAVNKELLDWQHKAEDKYNFIVAHDTDLDSFVGILGFIPVSRYDKQLDTEKDIWLAMWKTLKSANYPGLGLKLMEFLKEAYKPSTIGAIGINRNVRNVYKFMRYKVDVLNHYYFMNQSIDKYLLASGDIQKRTLIVDTTVEIKKITDLGAVEVNPTEGLHPRKSLQYLIERYEKHPIYHYLFFGVYHNASLELILVIRKAIANNASCLRIVDMYGNFNFNFSIASPLHELLVKQGAEYADCLNSGLPVSFFEKLGFCMASGTTVIPNFFEPFVSATVNVEFGIKAGDSSYVIFKGDSDQDRPSVSVIKKDSA